jgi:hypothetical protein
MDQEWTPAMAKLLGLADNDLPVIWEPDFLLGSKDATLNY